MAGEIRLGRSGRRKVRLVRFRQVWNGLTMRGELPLGVVSFGRYGEVMPGEINEARNGSVRQSWSQKGGNDLIYQWKLPGIMPVDAQTAGNELQRIYERDGVIEPETVVLESESPSAPLHSCFEWDDEKAAHKYRITQAQGIIRAIVAVDERQENPDT